MLFSLNLTWTSWFSTFSTHLNMNKSRRMHSCANLSLWIQLELTAAAWWTWTWTHNAAKRRAFNNFVNMLCTILVQCTMYIDVSRSLVSIILTFGSGNYSENPKWHSKQRDKQIFMQGLNIDERETERQSELASDSGSKSFVITIVVVVITIHELQCLFQLFDLLLRLLLSTYCPTNRHWLAKAFTQNVTFVQGCSYI